MIVRSLPLKSAPAQKPRPAPVRTTQRMERSSRISRKRSSISSNMCMEMAFSFSGRLNVTQRMPPVSPRRSVSRLSYGMAWVTPSVGGGSIADAGGQNRARK